ncbi:MAG: alcohol dehydrogenase catalytic domain-containing protein [Actinomycetes bacterium]
MPSDHRAVVATAANSLTVAAVPTPDLAPDLVAVRIAVTGINPVDAHVVAGAFGADLFPYIAGCEYGGTVIGVGAGVTGFAIGDRVAGQPKPFMGDPGSWQDVVVVGADKLAHVPGPLSDEAAGTVPLLSLTALTMVRAAGLSAGQRAVVPGAAGGVGRWLTQLLLADGVEVTTVTSARDLDAMTAFGATAIDRDDPSAVDGLRDFAAIFDVAGGDEGAVAVRRTWLAEGARYLSVSVRGEGIEFFMVEWDAAALETMLSGVADGTFAAQTPTLYAPEDVAAAIADFMSRTQARTALDLRS